MRHVLAVVLAAGLLAGCVGLRAQERPASAGSGRTSGIVGVWVLNKDLSDTLDRADGPR
jgi:hypothetical protein